MKTTVLISTQTSATASICRIIEQLTKSSNIRLLGLDASKKEVIGENFDNIPEEGYIVLHNRPNLLKHIKNPERYRYLINFRDPRDRLCNSFFWMQQHPLFPGEQKEEINKRAIEIRKRGINKWVIENSRPQYELALIRFLHSVPNAEQQVATYADLCLNFDSFLKKVSSFIKVDLTQELLSELESERCDNLVSNKSWIGSRWEGADILPGRYKRELTGETIERLNEIYHEVLSQMTLLDIDNKELYRHKVIQNELEVFNNILSEYNPAEVLRDTALAFEETGDIKTAMKIMKKAQMMRPNGPLINIKIKSYIHFLNRN